MGIFSGLFKSRDKPKDSYDSPSYSYFFGRTQAGKRVNDRTALQIIAVYACVRVLSEALAQLPLHVYQYTDKGKERVPQHPLYFFAARSAESRNDIVRVPGNADEPPAYLRKRRCTDHPQRQR